MVWDDAERIMEAFAQLGLENVHETSKIQEKSSLDNDRFELALKELQANKLVRAHMGRLSLTAKGRVYLRKKESDA